MEIFEVVLGVIIIVLLGFIALSVFGFVFALLQEKFYFSKRVKYLNGFCIECKYYLPDSKICTLCHGVTGEVDWNDYCSRFDDEVSHDERGVKDRIDLLDERCPDNALLILMRETLDDGTEFEEALKAPKERKNK